VVGSTTRPGESFALPWRDDQLSKQQAYDLAAGEYPNLRADICICRENVVADETQVSGIFRRTLVPIEEWMHKVTVRQEIIDRVLARRGRYHWFDELDPRRTALVVIDMQELFCAPGAPAEVPGSREIVESINALTEELRKIGVPVIWVLHANTQSSGRSDWELFFNHIVADEVREKTRQSLAPGRQKVWSGLTVGPADTTINKNRYSALIAGSSSLERLLRSLEIDTVLIAGTKTNICCESTARDAMMLDFKTVMVSDCCAALSDDEHRAALENMIQQFGDVMTGPEVLERLRRQSNR
jgi:ureidoacrylate peracid hydrolase